MHVFRKLETLSWEMIVYNLNYLIKIFVGFVSGIQGILLHHQNGGGNQLVCTLSCPKFTKINYVEIYAFLVQAKSH